MASNSPTPTGDCIEAAGKFITGSDVVAYPDDYRLVHGNVQRLRQDVAVNHAWVEEGEVVHEVSNGRQLAFLKEAYYRSHGVKNVRRYTPGEALVLCLDRGHWGPWD